MEKSALGKQKEQIEALRAILHSDTREERIARMSPENRVIYEEIIGLRNQIGRIEGFDIIKELRQMRGYDDESTCH